ncbi:MAG: TlpA family protein disulfide reductase [Betaproteobacteria bacterium]|nr:TlpA family protein disulfide reductase [Betaproteobacteria bacterium]
MLEQFGRFAVPNKRWRALLAGLILSLFGATSAYAAGGEVFSPVPGTPLAPKLKLKNMDGKEVSLEKLRGKVVIINFWATWCPPCRREMPSLQRLWLQHGGKTDLQIVAVNIGENAETVLDFMGTLDAAPTFTIVFDKDSAALRQWPIKGLPTTFLLDRKGRIVYRAIGGREFDSPESIAVINKLLAEEK